MKISACWIAKNEESNIGLSIKSVMDIADELIVVDTGSTDDTVAIAESLGARVEYFEWVSDFSAARNYALSLASGDIAIFLDADEWFTPSLGPADRNKIIEAFASTQAEVIWTRLDNIDKQSGRFMNSAIVTRIFLNRETIRYIGRIHEYLDPSHRRKDAHITDSLHISHSGYSDNIITGKLDRNIELLESGLSAAAEDSDDRVRFMAYLVRERHNRGEFKKTLGYLTEILKRPDALKRLCRFHGEAFIAVFYPVMWTTTKIRSEVSRRAIQKNLFELFKNAYPNYPGSAEIDLLYQVLFDFKEGRFLKEFDTAAEAARAKVSPISSYKEYEPLLYEAAAYAAWRRGDHARAKGYATFMLKDIESHGTRANRKREPLIILLNALRGQEDADVIVLLNGIFDISDPVTRDYLINETSLDGFLYVHSYLLKKRMDAGNAYIGDYMRFLLINKLHEALAPIAAEAYAGGDVDAARSLFMSAICGAPREIIEECSDMLGEYADVLSAYYNGERLGEVTQEHKRILEETYHTIAFVEGIEAADRYLDVFRANPVLCFLTKASYCEKNARLDQLLNENMEGIDRLNFACWRHMIQAMIAASRYDEALEKIEAFLNSDVLDTGLFHMLNVIVEKAPGDVGAKARRLYEQYVSLNDLVIDLADVVNTGFVMDGGGKKQNQFFRNMAQDQFDKYLTDEAERPAVRALPFLLRKAAEVYRKNDVPAEAARCLWRIIAHGQAEKADYEALSDIFTALKNTRLPDYIRGMAKDL